MENQESVFGAVIHSYTRAEAIEDGVLTDVSQVAREAGIRFPVALTSAVWAEYVEAPEGVRCQDESGRLWDILCMFVMAARANSKRSEIRFRVYVRNHNRRLTERDLVVLKSVCGPGDLGEPVITIMKPDED